MRRALASVLLVIGLVLLVPPTVAPAAPAETGRYYVVGPPVDGQREYLYAIALRTLGNGNRFREIVELNTGRVQPDGQTFTDGMVLGPGWILVLPRDARGKGVRTGPLPDLAPRPARPSPSRSAARPAPSSPSAPATRSAAPARTAPAGTPTVTAPGLAARHGQDVGRDDPLTPLLVRGGAGLLAVVFAVLALMLLRRGGLRRPAVALDDRGPWPPERHHTPTPAELSTPPAPDAPVPAVDLSARAAAPATSAPPVPTTPAPIPVGAGPAAGPAAPSPVPAPAASVPPQPRPAPPLPPAGNTTGVPAATTAPGATVPVTLVTPAEVGTGTSTAETPVPATPGSPAPSPAVPVAPAPTPAVPVAPAPSPAPAAPAPAPAPALAPAGEQRDVPRPAVPVAGEVPYLAADLESGAGPVRVRLVGVAAGQGDPAYAWLGGAEPAPRATVPLDLGRTGPWRLRVDLGRTPDVLTLVGSADACRRMAVHYARGLLRAGVGVAVVGDALGPDVPEGCRTLAALPDPPAAGEELPEPYVVLVAGLPAGAVGRARGLAAATRGRCVPVVIGPVPGGRWSVQVVAD
ncbi:hypothetical protein [Micromonospora sp. NPDC023956]|uniref:hypothetical protein n=1 Tax=Micromonospora sp. NPDC023956 TaxID=3155722 RepID=UPI0033DA2494